MNGGPREDIPVITDRSGCVTSHEPTVEFLYILMRDWLPAGKVESITKEVERSKPPTIYSNGWLAQYAKDVAKRLRLPEKYTGDERQRVGCEATNET